VGRTQEPQIICSLGLFQTQDKSLP